MCKDYVESFRVTAYDPEGLIKVAPEKFFYLNALAWNACLDNVNPGPFWYAGAELDRLLPKSMRMEMFRKVFGVGESGPAWHPVPLTAVLRAHQDELTAVELPGPYQVVELPDGLPKELKEAISFWKGGGNPCVIKEVIYETSCSNHTALFGPH